MSNSLRDTNVVIVEAESMARFGMVHLVNKETTLRVCGEANCLLEARALCSKHLPHVVVFDVAAGDGVNFIKDLKSFSPGARAVVHTGAADVILIQRAFKAGAFGYVLRSDPVIHLLSAIRGAVNGVRHVSPKVQEVMLGNLALGVLKVHGDGMPTVSNREAQVLRDLGRGLSNRQIASGMNVSIKTIETHCQRLKEKLGLRGTSALRQYAAIHGVRGNSVQP